MNQAGLQRKPEVRPLKPAAVLVVCAIAIAALAAYAQPLAIQSIHAYQRAGAPIAARIGLRCRFTPTCSRYAEAVVTRDGVVRGGWQAFKRIARCNPWTAAGTVDAP
jgi:putative membrane protein insertion efficiency factor